MKAKINFFLFLLIALTSCNDTEFYTFGDDVTLTSNISGIEILSEGDAAILISPQMQGRILTSTSKGNNGISYGYFNRHVVKTSDPLQNMNKMGGACRMWFGPEIGKYAIFFEPGTPQNANTIAISPQLIDKAFKIIERSKNTVTSGSRMQIRNANGYVFKLDVKRKIGLKPISEIERELNIVIPENISQVAYFAETEIKNIGNETWSKENGLLSIWDLSCIIPSPKSTVIIPTRNQPDSAVIYFTPIDDKRIAVTDRHIFYKADAAYMNKIGIQPENCKNVFGSYSPELNLLTIVKYQLNKDSTYVNSLWEHSDPYKGDVINIFNGEVNEKLDRNWPFYEMETSSAAKELAPGDTQHHMHNVYHFEGTLAELNKISLIVLGTELENIGF